MNHIAFVSDSADLTYFRSIVQRLQPHLKVSVWPEPECLAAEVAVCWNPPRGVYAEMPKLRLIHSIAAGVDNVVNGHDTRGLPVCRVVDPDLTRAMVEYVTMSVLFFQRQLDVALAQQAMRIWRRPPYLPAEQCGVGIMGMGQLGRSVAVALRDLGYHVRGWSRSRFELAGVESFAGQTEYGSFLSGSHILVCLLPLTSSTRGILSAKTFDSLPHGACLVHCGRGGHLVVDDLIHALADQSVRGAILDVFPEEPLAADSPLWTTPGVVVTPHMAAMADPVTVVNQVLENTRRLAAGQPLLNSVDVNRGY